ncbi:hypothetical protein DPMN_063146 [Dreissena polymorpha]|uniref:Uncharacterized protein n=1 Tax=Dreissena polymorpha TaxID=45954 RepID=A0A9D4CAT6_DREPO|nr:hypothetical protein DPMN_063146 [Dreissena polymorpha]
MQYYSRGAIERDTGNEPVQTRECGRLSYVICCEGRTMGHHEVVQWWFHAGSHQGENAYGQLHQRSL